MFGAGGAGVWGGLGELQMFHKYLNCFTCIHISNLPVDCNHATCDNYRQSDASSLVSMEYMHRVDGAEMRLNIFTFASALLLF